MAAPASVEAWITFFCIQRRRYQPHPPVTSGSEPHIRGDDPARPDDFLPGVAICKADPVPDGDRAFETNVTPEGQLLAFHQGLGPHGKTGLELIDASLEWKAGLI